MASESNAEFDAVVVGSGISGGWAAKELCEKGLKTLVLDMDSSDSPSFGHQEGSTFNGHFGCTCYHPLFVFNQFGDLDRRQADAADILYLLVLR